MAEAVEAIPDWAVRGEANPQAAANLLAGIIGAYRARREADWGELRRAPLEAAVAELASAHGPLRLDRDEAAWLARTIARFGRLFPEVYASVRLCGAGYGMEVLVGTLAAGTVPAEAWRAADHESADPGREVVRWFADARDEGVRTVCLRRGRNIKWVV